MTATTVSTPPITPVFLEIGVNGDMQKAVNEKTELSVILFDAFSPAKPLDQQRFRSIINPKEPLSEIATHRYGITAAQASNRAIARVLVSSGINSENGSEQTPK